MDYKLLYNTIKYLKVKQIIYRIIYKFPRKKIKDIEIDVHTKDLNFFIFSFFSSSLSGMSEANFLNKSSKLSFPDSWNDETNHSKLWLYNLHYFDWLVSKKCHLNINNNFDIINQWITDNPIGQGNGWESYTLSLRVINWIKALCNYLPSTKRIEDSLYRQCQFLSNNIEYHILGNHLFENAKALIFAGCFFSGHESDKWLKKGLDILDKEIHEQVLNDGANFELSPMYHNIILFDILDLYNLAVNNNNAEVTLRKNSWGKLAVKMLSFSEAMSHPDGEVSFFNDSAIGIAPPFKFLKYYAENLGINVPTKKNVCCNDTPSNLLFFDKAGYVAIESSSFKAILDVAKVGPDYIPGHGHADTLSFELSFFGERVFVNSGTSEYGLTKERLRQRQTAAHNTIDVDGEDSSEVWSGFRVARRAYPSTPLINQSKNNILISSSHNGYKRLSGNVTHKRIWDFNQSTIIIEDQLIGNYKKATAHYHIHPDINVYQSNSNVVLTLKCGKQIIFEANAEIKIINTTWHPEFGIVKENKKIVLLLNHAPLIVTIRY